MLMMVVQLLDHEFLLLAMLLVEAEVLVVLVLVQIVIQELLVVPHKDSHKYLML